MPHKSVLFVDDEENILRGLKRMLHRYSKEWDMHFANGGEEALNKLKDEPVKVLVTDMKMPGMSGVELMQEVKRKYPSIIRIVLSGHSERDDVIKSASLAHQYLAKPCKSEKLIEVINQTYYLNSILKNEEVKRVISTIEALPALPNTYFKLMEELESPDFSLKKIGDIVSADMGMSTSILKQVNSSFWGLANHISSPEQAVNMLGGDIVKALVLSSHIFHLIEDTDLIPVDMIEKKSLLTGRFAKIIGEHIGVEKKALDNSFIASLLQDVGRLILINNFPETYRVVVDEAEKNPGYDLRQAELSVMGVTHAEVGAYLLGLWGLPQDIVAAVALHHTPVVTDSESDIIIAISYLSCKFALALIDDKESSFEDVNIDMQYCSSIGISEEVESYFNKCQTVFKEVKNES